MHALGDPHRIRQAARETRRQLRSHCGSPYGYRHGAAAYATCCARERGPIAAGLSIGGAEIAYFYLFGHYYAAHVIDTAGVQEAQIWISKIKAAVPAIAIKIIDDAIQMHGAAGLSQDFPLAVMYTHARTLRLADGPDEVHRMVVARNELRPYLQAARS